MKIAIVGLGAVGGLIAVRLAQAGHSVSALARGATLQAVRERGLALIADGRRSRAALQVSDDAGALGPQDLVIIALKGQALPAVAPTLAPLLTPDTTILTAMNGVPWWFLETPALAETLQAAQRRLHSVDPDGSIETSLPFVQVLGGVVHLTARTAEPGEVVHGFGNRLIIGEPVGGLTPRVHAVAEALRSGGFTVEESADLRHDLWFKLWGNMTTNPVSALTGATADRILDDPLVAAFCLRAMAEAAAVGERIGCPIAQSGEERHAVTRQLGAFKTSMLQDAEAGRPLELDALVGAVVEIGHKVGVATPNIEALLGLTRLMAATRGLLPR